MTKETTYPACVSQKQADMFQHAVHDADYAASRDLSVKLAQGKHEADIREGKWGKCDGCPCPHCEKAAREAAGGQHA